jgi:hypothetical protein
VDDIWFPESLRVDTEAYWLGVAEIGADGEHTDWKRLAWKESIGWRVHLPGFD